MTDDILTIKELADYLKLNEKTTYRLASKGDIPGLKIGGSWRPTASSGYELIACS